MLRRAIEIREGTWQGTGDGFEAAWPLRVAGRPFDLRTEIVGVEAPPLGTPVPEAALVAVLVPALRRGRPIRIPRLASERLAASLPQIQRTLRGFFPRLKGTRVHTAELAAEIQTSAERGAGLFISLGIDSFYTLLLMRRSITDLVLVRGFDPALDDDAHWARAIEAAEEVAAWTDTRLVLVRTNVRSLLDQHVDWNVGQGAALAHVGLTLTPWLERILVASAHHQEPFLPHGSHPDLDPLWSTEWLEIESHGADVRRIDTLAYVAREKLAMDHLRVCRTASEDALNCGRCEKCLLAMLGLEVVDALEHCRTLPHEIPDGALRGIETWSATGSKELEALRDAWRDHRPGTPMLDEIRAALNRAHAEER